MHLKLIALKYAEGKLPGNLVLENGTEQDTVMASFLYYLIQLDGKNILVDVGDKPMPNYYQNYQSPIAVLNEYGLHAEDIDSVIITHAHHDHIGALQEYKSATIYIQEDEYIIAMESGDITDEFRVQTFRDALILYDVLKIQKIGGHRPGSSIVSFVLDNHEYVLCGDECYIDECFEKCIPTGNSFNPANSKAFIEKYADAYYIKFTFHNPKVMTGRNGHQITLEVDI